MMAMTSSFVDIKHPEQPLPDQLKGGVVAIGNFDGMHRGHQAVLEDALQEARQKGLKAIALTFEPHPRTLFRPDRPIFRLTPHEEKARIAHALGLDGMISMAFDQTFSSQSPDKFFHDMLIEGLDAKQVIAGYDFHFGKNRTGNPDYLRQKGAAQGIDVTIVDMKTDRSGDAVSSTRVRQALEDGVVETANRLLGYRFFFSGVVIHGAKNGRKLGYPTANMALPDNCRLCEGVYAVKFIRANGSVHHGVASFGRRPMFDNGPRVFEVHVFDFDDNLYGEEVRVVLHDYLRPEMKFNGLDGLIKQMDTDSVQARAILRYSEPLSELDARLWSA
ncbi:bifunctional riboflavin kinase/FAD synthetase [uncultured Cohaesibacter sp.]|uniref:bifunctional riboflavin kinase/FAD synthetase n=1 Tax=uncultured Cohaesibacter sp. TaxID=1002546 RepID=UPI00292D40BF|nr:bifunctional riboflavin kinase/FAD synthetase [uncultured Cohaesibacter sp.]